MEDKLTKHIVNLSPRNLYLNFKYNIMFYNTFKSIRKSIADYYRLVFDEKGNLIEVPDESPIRDVLWFNNQIANGNIAVMPVVFIEFGSLSFSVNTKFTISSPLTIRLWIVNNSVSNSDGQIADTDLMRHNEIVEELVNILLRTKPDGIAKPLFLSTVEYQLDYAGYMVTSIEFTTTKQLDI